jgi:hypothetical protein
LTGSWLNTVDEVTSMRIWLHAAATGIVRVYKRANISLPIYEPNYIDTNLYTMELVKEWNITNSGIDQTFTWDGDVDDYVEFQVMNMEVPPTSNIKLRFNNDTGSNYLYQYTSQDGSAFAANTASSQTYALITNSYNDLESSTTKCFLKNNGQERALYSERVTQRTDNTDNWHIGHTGQIWQNSADKVTSITVYSDNTDITGTLRMYKRVNLQLPVSGIGSTTFSGLSDTPANYGTQGDYLVSTGSGVEYFSRHKAKMTRDAAQTIPNTTNTKVAFDNVVYDEGNITSVSGSKFVITSSGTYSISTKLNMASMSGDVLTYIYINSTAVAGSATINNSTATLTDTFVLDATDEVEFYVYHNYGSDRDTNTTTFKPSMSVVQI